MASSYDKNKTGNVDSSYQVIFLLQKCFFTSMVEPVCGCLMSSMQNLLHFESMFLPRWPQRGTSASWELNVSGSDLSLVYFTVSLRLLFFFSSSRPGFNKWSSDKKIHSQLGNTFRHLSSWEWNLKARWNHKSSARWILATNGCIPPAGRREFIRDKRDFF